ncbi:MAG TPA: hypothetical protein DIT25_03585 [Candidatus Moranbacteria bacterium]|nr:hypothetical protein [Candidatus Moranbacteria bacterium]
MKKTKIAGLIAIIAAVVIGIAFVPETMAERPIKKDRSVRIEGATPENSVVYLGKSYDKKAGKMVDGYAIVHYAKSNDKPTRPSSDAKCYGFLSKGAKWKTAEPWVVDSAFTGGLGSEFILENMEKNIAKWESASGDKNILGSGSSEVLGSFPGTYNDSNEVSFATIENQNAIAVTYVWGYFSGPTFQRELVEWDQIYNDKYPWTQDAEDETTKMDFENIATHELGHSVGMGDLYTTSCSEQTMYGYANYGEINKRDLEAGDIAGIRELYK